MAKKMYIGVDNKARNVKKMYIGVDGVAKRIKKAYIGIGGKARPFLSSDPIEYYGTKTLNNAKYSMGTTTINNHIIFAGGRYHYSSTSSGYRGYTTVEAFDKSLTLKTLTELTEGGKLSGTTIGSYAIFSGKSRTSSDSSQLPVDVYDNSLTKMVTVQQPGTTFDTYSDMSAANTTSYAIFGGNSRAEITSYSTRCSAFAYNSSLTLSEVSNISPPGYTVATSIIGNNTKAFFYGNSSLIDVNQRGAMINDSLSSSYLNYGTLYASAASTSTKAIFVGGWSDSEGNTESSTGIAYDNDGTGISLTNVAIANGVGCGHSNYALFAGGYGIQINSNLYSFSKSCFVLDKTLAKIDGVKSLSKGREFPSAGTVGDYMLVAGGESEYTASRGKTGQTDVIDIYIAS